MLIDNINYLRKYNRPIREYLNEHEEEIKNMPFSMFETRSGHPTLKVELDNKSVYIHSKYDPVNEAEQLINKYRDEIENYQHIFLYGLGLGYALEAFVKWFPNLTFTIYEPNPSIFYHYLCHRKLEDLPLKQIKNIHMEMSNRDRDSFINGFADQLEEDVLLITLPSYERVFEETHKEFLIKFKEYVKNKKSGLLTDFAYEKRWTINSMMNFSEVLNTPNILHDIDKENFKGKPVIIVAAGPSLNEELDNLHYIKTNKLAYIFAVGSANKTLIKNSIIPDAVCSYDPQGINYRVYSEIIEDNRIDIPLIFGSSVGFETVEKYPGPKLHMLTSQDTISNYYLVDKDNPIKIVNDAPSIAVVTFQLLCQLEANPIILVGQNLGYKDKHFYSKGIEYESRTNTITEDEITKALVVKDVDGNDMLTNETFLSMKRELEHYIKYYSSVNVINTTAGGAHIEGSIYQHLNEVISQQLDSKMVNSEWHCNISSGYKREIIKEKQKIMNSNVEDLNAKLNHFVKTIRNIDSNINNDQPNLLEMQFVKFDHAYKDLMNNHFFKIFMVPMLRVSLEILNKKIQSVRFNKDIQFKAREIVRATSKFTYDCQTDLKYLLPIYYKLNKSIDNLTEIEVSHYES